MTLDSKALEILQEVRLFLERFPDASWGPALDGACAIGSFLGWKLLTREGYKPKLVMAECDHMSHCWVKLGKKVLDVTATQFGEYPPVLVLPVQKYSKLDFVKEMPKKLFNEKAVEVLREDWPERQIPWTYAEEIWTTFGLEVE